MYRFEPESPGGEQSAGTKGKCRTCDGRGCMHRLWSLRSVLSQRFSNVIYGSQIRTFKCLPHGRVESSDRVRNMVSQMEAEGFGHCTNHLECEAACPKQIGTEFIARMNRDYWAPCFLPQRAAR